MEGAPFRIGAPSTQFEIGAVRELREPEYPTERKLPFIAARTQTHPADRNSVREPTKSGICLSSIPK
jgi:hypothetical protein